jgi:hypothetical protein
MTKRLVSILSITVLIGIIGFFSSCTRITTRRDATINRSTGTVDVIVSGFVAAFLTPEGPFPRWSRHLQIIFNDPKQIPETETRTFSAGSDFSSLYNKVSAGSLTIDPGKKVVVVNVRYSSTYWYETINGEYPIRD